MAEEGKITDDDDFDTEETEVEVGKITDDDDGDTPECEKKEYSNKIADRPAEKFDNNEWDWPTVKGQESDDHVPEPENHRLEYAHEINLQLLKLILYLKKNLLIVRIYQNLQFFFYNQNELIDQLHELQNLFDQNQLNLFFVLKDWIF